MINGSHDYFIDKLSVCTYTYKENVLVLNYSNPLIVFLGNDECYDRLFQPGLTPDDGLRTQC